MRFKLYFIQLLLLHSMLFAQHGYDGGMKTQPWKKTFMDNLTVGGYYRLFYFDRSTKTPYGDLGSNRQISVIDPTYYDPMLFLYVGGNISTNTTFGAELRTDSYLLGAVKDQNANLSAFNGLVLRTSTRTKHAGNYFIRFGGIEWMSISPFTFGGYSGFNRFSIWNRRPWDPGGNVKKRPASYYHNGTINQDVRFGTNAFKGLMVDITALPYGLTANLLYGKSGSYSGFDRQATVTPRKVYGGKLEKNLGALGTVGISTYNTLAYQDSLNQNYDTRKQFHLAEVYSTLNFDKKLSLFIEAGYGVNKEPQFKDLGGSAFMLDVKSTKESTKLPIDLRIYRFGEYFINLDSYVGNTTLTPYLDNFYTFHGGAFRKPGPRVSTPGDLTNNRQGITLNSEARLNDLKVVVGVDLGRDLNRFTGTNELSYAHRINGLELSRMVPFPNNGLFGPNERMGTFYRGAYEVVHVIDTASDGGFKKQLTYSSIDIQLKHKMKIANHDLYLFNLNTLATTGYKAFSKEAFIQANYHEFEAYYHLWRDLTVSAYYGTEFIKGSDQTDKELISGLSRDQHGTAYGLGIDFQINNQTFLYLREKIYAFEDKAFESENFSGHLFTLELKAFF